MIRNFASLILLCATFFVAPLNALAQITVPTVPSQDLQIWHYTDGGWNPVANETINTLTDTITFTTDSFSPFILGTAVPEPSSFVLMTLGASALFCHARRRCVKSR